jgi:hypothetical protein
VREAPAIEPVRASTAIDVVEGKNRFKRGRKKFLSLRGRSYGRLRQCTFFSLAPAPLPFSATKITPRLNQQINGPTIAAALRPSHVIGHRVCSRCLQQHAALARFV